MFPVFEKKFCEKYLSPLALNETFVAETAKHVLLLGKIFEQKMCTQTGKHPGNISSTPGDFRLEYENEIEYEYDFSNLAPIL